MKKKLLNDIIGWDVTNWGESIKFFEQHIDFSSINNALELGIGSYGGYSLYFASKGIKTICSNPTGDFREAKAIHSNYSFSKNIQYEKIDALNIPYENHFDCIGFKSVMGVLGYGEKDRYDHNDRQINMIKQAKALKKMVF